MVIKTVFFTCEYCESLVILESPNGPIVCPNCGAAPDAAKVLVKEYINYPPIGVSRANPNYHSPQKM